MSEQAPSWSITRSGARSVVARFDGQLTESEGARSAAEFVAALGDAPCDVVFDVRAMRGYESGARRAWQDALWPRRKQLASLTVVGGNAIVKMGASMLALALGIDASFRDA